MSRTTIEFPSTGATYFREEYGVYRYDTYPRSSVLAGQTRRSFLGSYASLEEARADYPTAYYSSPQYAPPDLSHLPDEGDL